MISDFWGPFLTNLHTHIRFYTLSRALFTSILLVTSDFHEPAYLPKNQISYVDGPKAISLNLKFAVVLMPLEIKRHRVPHLKDQNSGKEPSTRCGHTLPHNTLKSAHFPS